VDPFRALRYARRYRNWREVVRETAAGRPPARVVLRDGTVFEAPPDVNPARAANGIWFQRCYEPRGFALRRGDVVVDVGANVGVFAVHAARRGAARVLAVEPHPGNADFLERNLRANGAGGVEVVRCALADRTGSTRLRLAAKGVAHRLFERDEDGALLERSIEVPVDTLAGLCRTRGLARIDFLKLDCEGAEGLILASLTPEWLGRIDRLAMEFHDGASPLGHDAMRALLEQAGFQTSVRWDGRSTRGFLYARRSARPGGTS
jgi:FkbM family methyltransferase